MSFFDKIKAGLKKTKENTAANINAVFATFRTVDEDLLSDLEDALILADIGAYTASEAIEELRKQSKLQNLQTKEAVIDCLAKILADKMAPNCGLQLNTKPSVILMVGVNGVGKTTSIGKIGAKLSAEGKKVLFAAADTFRAAAADQLTVWEPLHLQVKFPHLPACLCTAESPLPSLLSFWFGSLLQSFLLLQLPSPQSSLFPSRPSLLPLLLLP